MGWAGQRLASHLGGLSWPVTYVALVALYVVIHYFFVSQSSQVLALMGVFLDVGIRGGVNPALMAFALLFASSYFSVITPQGGSQNVIFVAGGISRSANSTGSGCCSRSSSSPCSSPSGPCGSPLSAGEQVPHGAVGCEHAAGVSFT